MAPKKAAKTKKEEVIEIPKTELLPDGTSTHFVGGWSTHRSFSALEEITKAKDSGDVVMVLPGEVTHSDPVTVEVRSLTVSGVAKQPESVSQQPNPEGDAEGEGDGADGENDAPVVPAEPAIDTSVSVSGSVTLTAWVPPVEVRPPTPPPAEDDKKSKDKKAKDKKGKAAAKEEEEAAPPPPPPVEEEAPKGANPSTWPTVTFKHLCFRGGLTTKGVHLVFEQCHFVGGPTHQVQVHQYCKVSFSKCTFSQPARACIYAYPTAVVEVTGCVFTGGDLEAEQQAAQQPAPEGAAARAAASAAAARGVASVGVQSDNAIVTVRDCKFRRLAIGVLLHDKCKGSAITKCQFDFISNTAVHVDGAAGLLQGNKVRRCEYYGLVFKGQAATKVLQNELLSKVRVGKGAVPLLHSNSCAYPVVDENDAGNVYMQPTY